MASPHASSFICLPFGSKEEIKIAYESYYSVCLGSATVGTLGSALFLYQVVGGAASKSISRSQKSILINLAIADLCADIGVITRSLYYLCFWEKNHYTETDLRDNLLPAIGSTIIELWVIFWYLVSYFWTFFFAVDIYTSKHEGRWRLYCSHIVTWFYCILLAGISMLALWVCIPQIHCDVDKYCLVGHFLSTFGPILVFLISLPIFYFSTLQRMGKSFKQNSTVDAVRQQEKEQAKKKIFVFILVFYFCWLVNVIDGIILIIVHLTMNEHQTPFPSFIYEPEYIYTIWIIEAAVNPLQGLLNALAYGNTCQWLSKGFNSLRNKISERYNRSYSGSSGEYIEVDFRKDRGSIWTNQRKTILSC